MALPIKTRKRIIIVCLCFIAINFISFTIYNLSFKPSEVHEHRENNDPLVSKESENFTNNSKELAQQSEASAPPRAKETILRQMNSAPVRKLASVQDPEVENPELTPPPTPKMLATIGTAFKRGAFVAFNPSFSIITLVSKDSDTNGQSTVASNYVFGLATSYMQDWSEKFQTSVDLTLGVADFAKPTETSRRGLTDANKFLFGLGFSASHNFSERFNLKFNLDYNKRFFVRAASTQNNTVDAVNVPALGTKISYELANLDPFKFGIAGVYNYILPAQTDDYSIRSGGEYAMSFYLRQSAHKTEDSNFKLELGFSQRNQNTSVASQTETSITLNIQYLFSVGRRQGDAP